MRDFSVQTAQGLFSGEELIERYRRWRDRSDWLKFKRRSCGLSSTISGDYRFSIDVSYFGVKVAKRGNDVYRDKVKRRFRSVVDCLGGFSVFRTLSKRGGEARAFFVTLTWDVGYCRVEDAWRNDSEFGIGKMYNRWITGIRARFGRVNAVRVWDSIKQGYPHIHVLLVFPHHWLPVFCHQNRDGKRTWRVEDSERSIVKGNWPFFVDVYAATSVTYALGYMTKRAGSGTAYGDSDHGDRTLALTWAFRKRGYGISGDLIVNNRNSNVADTRSSGDIWAFLGVFSALELGLWDGGRPFSSRLVDFVAEAKVGSYG